MSVLLNPYLAFNGGKAEEAMNFYQSVFGGELQIMRFSDLGGMGLPEDQQSHVMHSALTNDAIGLCLFGSDSGMGPVTYGNDTTVSLSGDDTETLTRWYEQLSAGGEVTMPLAQAPWGDSFGQWTDKYGIAWMMNIAGQAS